MKCNVCGQEFGNGAYCQHCNADRITALGNYSGGYNAPGSPKNVTTDNGSKQSGIRNSGEQFMVCYSCANVIPVDSEYCPCCRTKLFEVCPKCGHRYSSQYNICNKCGTNREEYLEEQRVLEQRRKEEERRQKIERKKRLEEQKKDEQQRQEKKKFARREKTDDIITKIVNIALCTPMCAYLINMISGWSWTICIPIGLILTILWVIYGG